MKKSCPAELTNCYAVFVSNEGRTVPLWRQKAGRGDDKVVIWVNIFCIFSYLFNQKNVAFEIRFYVI